MLVPSQGACLRGIYTWRQWRHPPYRPACSCRIPLPRPQGVGPLDGCTFLPKCLSTFEGGWGGKLGLSNGLDTGFGFTTLAAGVAVDSGVSVIAVACVVATPSLSPVLAASKKNTAGGGYPASVPAAKSMTREGVCQFPE